MRIQTPPFPWRASAARAEVLQALACVEQSESSDAAAREDAVSARSSLEGYEPDVKAIKFDRPDRDVSGNGLHLRGKTDAAAPSGRDGLTQSDRLEEQSGELRQHIEQALTLLTAGEGSARGSLERARSDTKLYIENTLPHLTVSMREGHREAQEELSPYITEVQEDSPGRDVGRFADDIGQLFGDAIVNYKQGALGAKFVSEDLANIKASLEAARDRLK